MAIIQTKTSCRGLKKSCLHRIIGVIIMLYRNSYHGAGLFTQGLTGMGTWKAASANGFGMHHVNLDVYF